MAILVSQATANDNTLSLTSNDANNTFYGSSFIDKITYSGSGNFTMLDVSTGDEISIAQNGNGTTAALNGNTITLAVGGHTYTLGGIADNDTINIKFTGDSSNTTLTRAGNNYSVGSTLLVSGAVGVAFVFGTNLTAAQFIAQEGALLLSDTINVLDSSANIQTNLVALLAAAKVDNIGSSDNNAAITLSVAQELISANMDKIAAANTITVADLSATIQTNLVALLADSKVDNIDSSENGVAVTLTDTQAAVAANMAKLQTGDTIIVNAGGATAAELTGVSSAIAKVDSITNLTVTTATQSDTETANLLSKASAATVVATGASAAEIGSLVTNIANIAAVGISGTGLSVTDTQFAALGSKLANTVVDVIVNATGASAAELTALSTDIANVGSITNLTVTTATQSDTETANLLSKASGASVVATGASATEITSLITSIANIGASGISGTGVALTDTQFAVLGSKLANAVTVSVNASSATAGEIAAMMSDVANIAAQGITGTGVTLTDTQFAVLGSKLADALTDVTVNATSATVSELTAIETDIANIGTITNVGTASINAGSATGALVLIGAADTNTVTVTNFGGTALTGSAAKFNVTAGTGAQTIVTGALNDTIAGGAGADVISTGAGTDSVVYATTNAATVGFVDTGTTGSTALIPDAGDTYTGTEVIKDFVTGDTLTLGNAAAVVDGNGTLAADEFMIIQGTYTGGVFTAGTGLNTGADSLLLWDDSSASGGVQQSAAVLVGITAAEEAGIANLLGVLSTFGAAAASTLATGAETKTGTSGDDIFSGTDGDTGPITFDGISDNLNGNGGSDTLNLTMTGVATTSADADWTNISNFENIAFTTTGAGEQTITTGAEFDGAFSGNLDLTAQTASGAITIDMLASTKPATVTATTSVFGAQTITTGTGLTTVTATTFEDSQTITGANLLAVNATATKGAQTITSTGSGAVTVTAIAGDGAQTVTTAGGDDLVTLTTKAGNLTTITTNAGNDTIVASLGTDAIISGAGNDSIDGGAGVDAITGGANADVFVYRNHGATATTWLTTYGGDALADYGNGTQNTTALANATMSGLSGDVLLFDYSDLAGLSGFVANTGFVVTGNIPTGTNGTTGAGATTIAQGAGTIAADVAYAQFVYDSSDGMLRFDADGTGGAAAAIVVGTLPTGLALTATDFLFVA